MARARKLIKKYFDNGIKKDVESCNTKHINPEINWTYKTDPKTNHKYLIKPFFSRNGCLKE